MTLTYPDTGNLYDFNPCHEERNEKSVKIGRLTRTLEASDGEPLY